MMVPQSMIITKWARSPLSTDMIEAVGVTDTIDIGSPVTGVTVTMLSSPWQTVCVVLPSASSPGAMILPFESTRNDLESL